MLAIFLTMTLALVYVDIYARPMYVVLDGKPMMCWPKDMRHLWEPKAMHVFACVAIDRELWRRGGNR